MKWLLTAATVAVLVALFWTAPRWLLPRLAARSPRCVYAIPTRERAVALTLDDGPDSSSTGEILRVLREHDAHATFFLISEHVRGQEALVSSIVADGHEIGNHLTRDEASIRLSPRDFAAAVRDAGAVLARFGPVRWLRPGSAWHNETILDTIAATGYRCALASVYPYDPYLPSSRLAAAYILTNVRPGAIVVLHERRARGRRTVRTLGRILPALRARGYRVLTLSELDQLRELAPISRK
jgi:peptidoglycan/xylan/chitin deacetylase (PgdA/CDA1 family)